MSESLEVAQQKNPVEILTEHIALRGAKLEYLSALFAPAMEVVSDMQRVNEILTNSERPELAMTRQVPQLFGDDPDNLGNINNFFPSVRSYGVRQYVKDDRAFAKEGATRMIGRRPYDDNEKATIRLLSGRGGYNDFLQFAAEQAVGEDDDWVLCH